MNQRLAAVEARRARLLERAAREREDVAQTMQSWAQPLDFVDRCVDAVRFVVARPPLVAGAAFILALLRPRRAFKWARRAFGLWQGYRWLNRKIAV
ncbi:MAG: YqjK-like family protein [Burkholderiales bacterium]|nr:YqjK-like family protein [Burkholderiales bacterium]